MSGPDEATVVVDGPQILVSCTVNGSNPYFFDSDYTIAGSTGFLLWEANWLLLRLIRGPPAAAPATATATANGPAASASAAAAPPGALPEPCAAGASATPTASAPAPGYTGSVGEAAGHAQHVGPGPGPGPGGPQVPLHLGALLAGRRVLDLGSGTGLAGLAAAAAGAHVLLTDLASVVAGSLRHNLQRNAAGPCAPPGGSATPPPPPASGPAAQPAGSATAQPGQPSGGAAPGCTEDATVSLGALSLGGGGGEAAGGAWAGGGDGAGPWAGAVRVGCCGGSAAVMALDWTEPLGPQVAAGGNDPREADFILAVDTVWLLDILHAYIDVVLAVLRHPRGAGPSAPQPSGPPSSAPSPPPPPSPSPYPEPAASKSSGAPGGAGGGGKACFMAFVERAGEDSKLFVKKEEVLAALQERGLRVEVLIAEDVDVDGTARPGRVLRLTLAE
ncbi:hypothetical protein HYH03_018133 [Edaphochlamys debaryana]|uniref:Uncharacterized protein n=1 Tax=Edaphochlamys debaryana TaxID=47281 RepID=A0A835XFV2_9CHLO|nr:hypothetical protein HYH03_018133 [Edaphochlamys debaryana]|eukprot:KAG2482956.1 hypothetical protein HYH03_018133 [Edaphochlamys debaryana]